MEIYESCIRRGQLHSKKWLLLNLSSASIDYRQDNNVFWIHKLISEENQQSQLLEVIQECPCVWSCQTISSWRSAQKSALSPSSWIQTSLTILVSASCFNPGEALTSYYNRTVRQILNKEGKISSASSPWVSSQNLETRMHEVNPKMLFVSTDGPLIWSNISLCYWSQSIESRYPEIYK